MINSLTIQLSQDKTLECVSVRDCMQVIDANGFGIVFICQSDLSLVGCVTDGDLRRYLLNGGSVDDSCKYSLNKDCFRMNINISRSELRVAFSERIAVIPLVDDNNILIDIASTKKNYRIPISEPLITTSEKAYVNDCLDTNWISSQGDYVQRFESHMSDLHSGLHPVAVSNGTVALQLCLQALGVGEGDEVILPNLTFAASINAVIHVGATPVLCDVDPSTWCIDIKSIKNLITEKTRAIMPVHLYGVPCDMDMVCEVANRYGLFVIEDCAEAIGSRYKGSHVGTYGDASAFSFFGNKTITTGEGGMCLFKDRKVFEKAKIIRDHGMDPSKKYWHIAYGHNFRMTNIQAAIGVAQLERFQEIISKKIFIGRQYEKYFFSVDGLSSQLVPKDSESTYWLFTVLLKDKNERDFMIEYLCNLGIDARPIFFPLSDMKIYQKYCRGNSLRSSCEVGYRGLSFPSSLNLDEFDITYICSRVKDGLNLLKQNKP